MWVSDEWMEIDNIMILCYIEIEVNDNGIFIFFGCGVGVCGIIIDDVIVLDFDCDNIDNGEIEIDVIGVNFSGVLEYFIDNGVNF